MKNNCPSFTRQYRQYRYLAKRLRRWNETGTLHALSATRRQRLLARLQRLYRRLSQRFAPAHLRGMLASAAFVLGLTLESEAQVSFAAPVTNPFGLSSLLEFALPQFVDLDDDGDLDLMVGEYYGNYRYYQNTGTATAPSFTAGILNPFGITGGNASPTSPAFGDLDGDGDLDMVSGEYYGSFLYYENTGTATVPSFAAPTNNPFGLSSANYYAFSQLIDLDDDGDLDILAGEYYGDFRYFENTGTATAPSFGAPQLNPFGLQATSPLGYFGTLAASDVDLDGDLDVIGGRYLGDLLYFENTGTASAPAFAAPQTNPSGLSATYILSAPTAGDLDGDGDFDLLVGELYGAMQYFENTVINNTAPVFDSLVADTICDDSTLSNYAFGLSDPDGDSLTVTATSSDQALLPDANLSLSGMAPTYLLTATPSAGQTGTVIITLTATDGIDTTTASFELVVELCNQAPVIFPPTDIQACVGDTLAPLSLAISDPDGDPLTVTATSSDQAVVPGSDLTLSGGAPTFTLTIAPLATAGSSTITLTATDGIDTTEQTFLLVVAQCNQPPSIAPIADQTVCFGDAFGPLALTISDPDGDPLTVTASSDNQAVVQDNQISVSGAAPTFALNISALTGQPVPATITVVADDGTDADTASFRLLVEICASLNQPAAASLKVYPNPAAEAVTVDLPRRAEVAYWDLHDLHGRLVRQFAGGVGLRSQRLSLQGLPAGTYRLTAHTDAGPLRVTLLKAD